MNHQPMKPPYTSDGKYFYVFCSDCSASTKSTDVSCDVEDVPGTFYCPNCANNKVKS